VKGTEKQVSKGEICVLLSANGELAEF